MRHNGAQARPDDGTIHLCVMRACGRITGFSTLLKAEYAQHQGMAHVEIYTARTVRVTPADLSDGGYMYVAACSL